MEKARKNFYSYFYKIPSEIVHQALINLPDAECGFILKAHNGSLLNGLKTLSPNEQKMYYDILYKIKRNITKIKNNGNKPKGGNRTLFERFPDYDILYKIKRAFGCLNPKYQMILVKAYGEDLSLPLDKEKLTADEIKCLKNIYVSLKNKLSNPTVSRKRINDYNLYDRFPEYSVSEINDVINGLTSKRKELLDQVYPDGLENNGQALKGPSDKSRISALFRIIHENLERNKQQSNNVKVAETVKAKKNIYEKFSAYEQAAVKEVFDTLGIKQQAVLRKVYGEGLTEPFENNSLSKKEKKTLSATFNIIESKLKADYKKKNQSSLKIDTSGLQQKTTSSPKNNK